MDGKLKRQSATQGDITDGPALEQAVRQSSACVLFHLASYGMSGRKQVSQSLANLLASVKMIISHTVEYWTD